ncbi:hypothetical protein F4777DRAFT_556948 [Nemania sp. FL0916]|nr:hypothetical protein F4777DRAFT_556948 [Nemania sp. FL0916]
MNGKKHQPKYPQQQQGSWDQDDGRYQYDPQGNFENSWENNAANANDRQRMPRGTGSGFDDAFNDLTTSIGSVNINKPGSSYGTPYPIPSSLPVSDSTASDMNASPQYTHGTGYHDETGYPEPHQDKGKGVASPASHDDRYSEDYSQLGPQSMTPSYYGQSNYSQGPDLNYTPKTGGSITTASLSMSGSGDNRNFYYPQSNDHDNDYELQQALKMSRDEQRGNSYVGASSASTARYNPQAILPGTYDFQSSMSPQGSGASSYAPLPAPVSSDDDTFVIRGTEGMVEPTDHRFVVEKSHKFKPGEVFKILWSEPAGQVFAEAPISDIRPIRDQTGEFYVGYRRFIIIGTDESHHSTCVPILTYERKGCLKKGVKANKHGIIYAEGHKPKPLKGEPPLGFKPVQLTVTAEGESLARESRVNYSKLVTIEHNVKVFFIGYISNPDFGTVGYAVDKCWSDKMQKQSKRSRK